MHSSHSSRRSSIVSDLKHIYEDCIEFVEKILTFPDMRTEVSRFNISCNTLSCFICVDVHCIQELANIVQRLEVLYSRLVSALNLGKKQYTSRSLGEVIASETASIVCLAVAKAMLDYKMKSNVLNFFKRARTQIRVFVRNEVQKGQWCGAPE